MIHENYLIPFHYLSFKLINLKKKEISSSNTVISIHSNCEFSTNIQTTLKLSSKLFQSKPIL